MTEQDLDGAEIRSSLQQMSRKAVPQGMRMDVPVFETCTQCGLLTRCPKHLGGYRMVRRMPPVAGKQPESRLAPESAPVGAQFFQQRRALIAPRRVSSIAN